MKYHKVINKSNGFSLVACIKILPLVFFRSCISFAFHHYNPWFYQQDMNMDCIEIIHQKYNIFKINVNLTVLKTEVFERIITDKFAYFMSCKR